MMIKTEEVKIETIGSNSNIKGIEKVETIYPKVIDPIPNYDYGTHQNQLDYNVALRNKPTGAGTNYKLGTFNITGTGNIAITGVGFKPKLVKFIGGDNSGNISYVSIGSMTATSQHAMNMQTSGLDTTRAIHIGSKCAAKYVSMDTDGFTINCDYFTNTGYIGYECYG